MTDETVDHLLHLLRVSQLRRQFGGRSARHVAGSGGIFDVEADGQLLFSKDKEHRFPANKEIVEKLEALLK